MNQSGSVKEIVGKGLWERAEELVPNRKPDVQIQDRLELNLRVLMSIQPGDIPFINRKETIIERPINRWKFKQMEQGEFYPEFLKEEILEPAYKRILNRGPNYEVIEELLHGRGRKTLLISTFEQAKAQNKINSPFGGIVHIYSAYASSKKEKDKEFADKIKNLYEVYAKKMLDLKNGTTSIPNSRSSETKKSLAERAKRPPRGRPLPRPPQKIQNKDVEEKEQENDRFDTEWKKRANNLKEGVREALKKWKQRKKTQKTLDKINELETTKKSEVPSSPLSDSEAFKRWSREYSPRKNSASSSDSDESWKEDSSPSLFHNPYVNSVVGLCEKPKKEPKSEPVKTKPLQRSVSQKEMLTTEEKREQLRHTNSENFAPYLIKTLEKRRSQILGKDKEN